MKSFANMSADEFEDVMSTGVIDGHCIQTEELIAAASMTPDAIFLEGDLALGVIAENRCDRNRIEGRGGNVAW
jgi:hypothetical protein